MLANRVPAIYARLSIEDKDVKKNDRKTESASISNQKKFLLGYAKDTLHENEKDVLIFQDDGYSGTNFERPQFIELMKKVRMGQISTIVVKDFSRLGRDYLEAGNFLDKVFPAYGVRFISINDNYDSDTHLGQTTGMDVGLKNVVNAMYSQDISKKNTSAFMVRYRRGEHVGYNAPYGYMKSKEDKHKLVIDPVAADIVRRIYQYSIDGLSTYNIAQRLNAEGIPSPLVYKKQNGIKINSKVVNESGQWYGSKIKVIIRDERYTGKMVSHRTKSVRVGSKDRVSVPKEEWIVVENTHEAIVSDEIYGKANEAMTKRMLRPGLKGKLQRKNLFTCPYCHHKLQFCGGKDNRKYLFCGYGKLGNDSECSGIHIEVRDIEEKVIQSMNMIGNVFLDSRKFKKRKSVSENSNEAKKTDWNKKLAAAREHKRKMYMKYSSGEMSRETFILQSQTCDENIQKYSQKVEQYELLISEVNSEKKQTKKNETMVREIYLMDEFDLDKLHQVLDAIYVDQHGNVELSFYRRDIVEELGIL